MQKESWHRLTDIKHGFRQLIMQIQSYGLVTAVAHLPLGENAPSGQGDTCPPHILLAAVLCLVILLRVALEGAEVASLCGLLGEVLQGMSLSSMKV